MAFFKFRKNNPSSQDAAGIQGEAAAPAETVDNLRRRALYRLIGAAVLVLVAIIGFPMLFDTQPRPVAVQAPIIIPDRNTAPPLAQPASASAHSVSAPVLSASSGAQVSPGLSAEEETISTANNSPASAASTEAAPPQAVPDTRAEQQQARRADEKRRADEAARRAAAEKRKADEAAKRTAAAKRKADEAARARALLDGKNAAPPASGTSPRADSAQTQTGHYVIQIGAFATAEATQITRQKAERAGVKTYTETAASGNAGPRTRVRVGPFASRDEAARALAKLRQAGLPGSILTP
jgi:DedD protein